VELFGRRDRSGGVPEATPAPVGERIEMELMPRGAIHSESETVDDLQIVRRLIAKHGTKQLIEMVEAASLTTQS
jgi:hypothetical protein